VFTPKPLSSPHEQGSNVVPSQQPAEHPDSEAPSGADDARWIALTVAGDQKAFAEMFRAYAEQLATYAYSIVDSLELAEEIVQDLFFSIWQRREQWVVQGTLKQYLYGSVRNRAFDVLKHRCTERRFHARAEAEAVASSAVVSQKHGPLTLLEHEELASRLQDAVSALPEQQRTIIRLRWFAHLTHAEIARVLGISVKTSENHANRALQRLRQLLDVLRER
jgi:RNA polymerase sigma-70 factor (ECF subfamily)